MADAVRGFAMSLGGLVLVIALVHAMLCRGRWHGTGEPRWKWAWRRSLFSALGVALLIIGIEQRVGQPLTYRTPSCIVLFVGVLWSIIGGAREAGGWNLTL